MQKLSLTRFRALKFCFLLFFTNSTFAEDLVEFSVFEKVYLNEEKLAVEEKENVQFELDRFNYKSIQKKLDTTQVSPSKLPDYKFEISVSSNSQEVIRRYTLSSKAYHNLITGDYESAIFYYQKFIKEFGSDDEVLTAMGASYQRLGDVETAKSLYEKVLNEDPANEIALNNYIVLIGDKDPAEGIKALNKIVKLKSNKIISAQLGYLYAKQQDYDSAKDAFESAFRSDIDDIKLSYNLALSYDKLGQNKSAYLMYKQILQNSRYRDRQYLIPRVDVQKRYRALEKLIYAEQLVKRNG
ncbi:MAG: tetratricopeptide repeat protein [Rickettsiales bacterium]|nr:tetratricopeptide repeat protein [Rickettsiales bacterium]